MMNVKYKITLAALITDGLELTAGSALKIARHFQADEAYGITATRLAMTWGALAPEAAKAEGFRCVGSMADDIADAPGDALRDAAEFWKKHVPAATGTVTPDQIIWNGGDFAANKVLATKIGAYVLVEPAPGGYQALIQTASGICEPGSAMARGADSEGFLQNAARNLNRLIAMTLGRLLMEDGVDFEEFLELQEDALCAEAAQRGIGIDAVTGKYPWE